MKSFVTNKNVSARLFKNPVLEYFSHIHPAMPVVVSVPVILYFLYQGLVTTPYAALPLWLAAILAWTLLEYTRHRWAFHFIPKGPRGKKIVFLLHGVHHDYPHHKTRLVMPLLISVPLALFFYYLFWAALAPYHNALFAGLVAGYVAYDCLHYAYHHFAMKGKVPAFLKIYHLKHHYSDPNNGFGVSNPIWDYVFGTVPKEVSQKSKKQWLDMPTVSAYSGPFFAFMGTLAIRAFNTNPAIINHSAGK